MRAVVIDNFENRSALSDAELIRKLQEQTRWDGPIYVITHDDEYIRVPKKNASEVPLRDQPGRIDSIAHAASSTEEHRSPKPTTEVRPLGGVPVDKQASSVFASGGSSEYQKGKRGSYPVTQEQIDEIVDGVLAGVRFPARPVYNPMIGSPGKTTIRIDSDGTRTITIESCQTSDNLGYVLL